MFSSTKKKIRVPSSVQRRVTRPITTPKSAFLGWEHRTAELKHKQLKAVLSIITIFVKDFQCISAKERADRIENGDSGRRMIFINVDQCKFSYVPQYRPDHQVIGGLFCNLRSHSQRSRNGTSGASRYGGGKASFIAWVDEFKTWWSCALEDHSTPQVELNDCFQRTRPDFIITPSLCFLS